MDSKENMPLKSFEDIIIGKNCVSEAIASGRAIDCVLISKDSVKGMTQVIAAKARQNGITVKEVDHKKLDRLSGGAAHQGVAAVCAIKEYASVDDILSLAESRNEPPFIVVLDGIEDPHNLGAIIRTAECAGAHGVIIPKRRSAGLTFAVGKASAGAVEYVPVARVSNLAAAIDSLKEKGLWVFGADMGGTDYKKCDFTGAAAVVIGNEGSGLSRIVKEKCDIIVSLPLLGRITSLNASVAAGILLYEAMNARGQH